MGYVKEQIAESEQIVEGVIIALDDYQKLRWARTAVPSISFYRYQISFKLAKGDMGFIGSSEHTTDQRVVGEGCHAFRLDQSIRAGRYILWVILR